MEGEKHLFISTPIQPHDKIARLFSTGADVSVPMSNTA